MATLTVRNLDDDLVRRLRIRAAENGRSAEGEHREILRQVLCDADRHDLDAEMARRMTVAAKLEEFRNGTFDPDRRPSIELLRDSRSDRIKRLTARGD